MYNYDKKIYNCGLLYLQDCIDKRLVEKDYVETIDLMKEIQKCKYIDILRYC